MLNAERSRSSPPTCRPVRSAAPCSRSTSRSARSCRGRGPASAPSRHRPPASRSTASARSTSSRAGASTRRLRSRVCLRTTRSGRRASSGSSTADGRAAAFTGASCLDWAGHKTGAGFAVQGNILAGEAVVDEMARAFEETIGPLVEPARRGARGRAGGGRRQARPAVRCGRRRAGRRAGASRARVSTASATCASRITPSRSSSCGGLSASGRAGTRCDARTPLRGEGPRAAADAMHEALGERRGRAAALQPRLLRVARRPRGRCGRAPAAVDRARHALPELAAGDPDFDPIRAEVAAL